MESLGSSVTVTNSAGAAVQVPKSPTQDVGKAPLIQAFSDLKNEAGSGLSRLKYSGKMAELWRKICQNYDLMPKNAEAIKAGNSDLTYTQEVILVVSYLLFQTWSAAQKSGFQVLLEDFTSHKAAAWHASELTGKLQSLVGSSSASPFPVPSP